MAGEQPNKLGEGFNEMIILPAIELIYCCRAFVQRYVSSDLFSTLDIANWSFESIFFVRVRSAREIL